MQKRKAAFPTEREPTEREQDILHLVAEYYTYQAIHLELGISKRTVENIIYRFMKRVDIHRIEHLIEYAHKHGYGRKRVSA